MKQGGQYIPDSPSSISPARLIDRDSISAKGHHCGDGSVATSSHFRQKVTHIPGKLSDRGSIKEKGHSFSRKAKRQRRRKRKRSLFFPEAQATEAPKSQKVTHIPEKAGDRGSISAKGHHCAEGSAATSSHYVQKSHPLTARPNCISIINTVNTHFV